MPLTRKQRTRLHVRINGMLRELGTLLLAFAPLDYLQQEHVDFTTLAGFVILGLTLVALSMLRELRGVR